MSSSPDAFDDLWTALPLSGASETLDPGETLTPQSLAVLRTQSRAPASRPSELPGDPTLPLAGEPRLDLDEVLARVPAMSVAAEGDLVPMEVLGTGGMGVVHRARQRSLNRDVAIKRLSRPDRNLAEGLLREAMVGGALEHPNVVPIHALGRDADGAPVLVMKRIEGRKWAEVVRADRPLSTERLEHHLQVLLAVADAVAYAHSKGVLHRDIKLSNVMVGEFGEVCLLDWGVSARIGARPLDPVGTPAYMAPEMLGGSQLDERTDVYLLGATLHHLIAGAPRHVGRTTYAVFQAAFVSAPASYGPEVPEDLAAIANQATARDPNARHPTVRAFQEALRAAERHRAAHVTHRAAAERLTTACSRLVEAEPDRQRIRDDLVTARFGLQEALRAWPDNAGARRDLRRCLELLVEHSLSGGDADGASEQLAELERSAEPGAFTALRERVDHDVRKRHALAKLGEGLDLTTSAETRQRWLFRLWVTTAAMGLPVIGAYRIGLLRVTHSWGFASSAGLFLVLAGALYAGRRRVLVNVVDQRIWYLVLLAAGSLSVNRALGWLAGRDPFVVLAGDLVILAAITASAAIAVTTEVIPIAVGLVAAAALAAVFPGATLEILTLSVASTFGALWFGFRRWA